MKRFPIIGVLLLVPALLMIGVVGCTTKVDPAKDVKDAKDKDAGKDKGDKDKATGSGKKVEITTALGATVKGVVKFKGAAPAAKDDSRIKEHKDGKFCAMGDVKEQMWIVGKDGGLANVVVSLAPPADKKFKLDDNLKNLSKKTVILDQPFCNYEPHVVALWPEVQALVAKNSTKHEKLKTEGINHNVKIDGGAEIGVMDFNLQPGKDTDPLYLKGAGEKVITASCSIHGWMNSKIALFTHPYFAVSNEKGEFEIKNVPIDTELTVYRWHESDPAKVMVEKMTFKKGDNELKTIEVAGK